MARLKIILSFDHELSLGGAQCYKTNLFSPTNQIMSLANKLKVPITLFTDILCAKRFKEWDEEGFFKHYTNQIANTIQHKHDVQLHLHPHWLDSDFKDGKYIPSKNFKLSDFYDKEWPNNIPGIVKQGVDFLTELCEYHDSDYVCIAYRAGGYNLAPRTGEILSSLYENGIRIESSVTKGYYFRSGVSEVNFRKMPKKANWFISKNGPIEREADSGLFEVPIAGRPRGCINNLPFLVKRVIYKRRKYQFEGMGIHKGNISTIEKLSKLFPKSVWTLNFDDYTKSVKDLMKIIKYYVKSHQEDNEIICSAISHPKSMGAYALSLMEGFIQEMKKDFGNEVEFCTYRQVYDELNLGT